jgi:hypothetical protein
VRAEEANGDAGRRRNDSKRARAAAKRAPVVVLPAEIDIANCQQATRPCTTASTTRDAEKEARSVLV